MSNNDTQVAKVTTHIKPALVKRPSRLWGLVKLAFILTLFTVGIGWGSWASFRPGIQWEGTVADAHDLRLRSKVMKNGRQIGEVVALEDAPEDRVRVRMKLFRRYEDEAGDWLRADTLHFVQYLTNTGALPKNLASVGKPAVVLVPREGSNAKPVYEDKNFVYRFIDSIPPPKKEATEIVTLWSNDSYGVDRNHSVVVSSLEQGLVIHASYVPSKGRIRFELMVPEYLARTTTRFRPKIEEIALTGVKNAPRAFFGAQIEAIPSHPGAHPGEYFTGPFEMEEPPMPVTKRLASDVSFLLFMQERFVGGNTFIAWKRKPAGIIEEPIPAADGHGFYAVAWVRAEFAPYLYSGTGFWVDKGLDIDLFRWERGMDLLNGDLGIDLGKINADPERVLKPVISFNTPENCGQPLRFDGDKPPTLTLHAKAKPEWTGSTAPIPMGTNSTASSTTLVPDPLLTELMWRREKTFKNVWNPRQRNLKGFGLRTPKGILMLKRLYEMHSDVDTKTIIFKVDWKSVGHLDPTVEHNGLIFLPLEGEANSPVQQAQVEYSYDGPLEDLIVLTRGSRAAIAHQSLEKGDGEWTVISNGRAAWEGAPVCLQSSGKLIGFYTYKSGDSRARVKLLTKEFSVAF